MARLHDLPIDVTLAEGRVLVAIQGAELFALIDDHLNAMFDGQFLVRLPGAGTATDRHELLCPTSLTLNQIQDALSRIPMNELTSAKSADSLSRGGR